MASARNAPLLASRRKFIWAQRGFAFLLARVVRSSGSAEFSSIELVQKIHTASNPSHRKISSKLIVYSPDYSAPFLGGVLI